MTSTSASLEAEAQPDLIPGPSASFAGGVPTPPDEPASARSAREFRSLRRARREAIDRFEVEYIRALLERSEGNVTRAAAIADVSRQVIHKLIAKHRL
jgi:two-component system, NtrC family, nitrogen regulation response regulator GlnG